MKKKRPVGIQIFGANLDSMLRSVEIVEKTNPDIIDINFGCPVKKVVSKGAGAGILKDIDLMVSLTEAMVKHTNLPITVKTRLGWDHDSIKIVEVAERLQDVGCKAISIHGRTVLKCIRETQTGNPARSFRSIKTQIVGTYFGTEEFENTFVFVSNFQAQQLVNYKENQFTGIEIKLRPDSNPANFASSMQEKLGK